MARNIFLSVIIPVFNEEKNIKPLYLGLKKNLAGLGKNFEIIFVNDGSTDKSEKILKDICRKDQAVFGIGHRLGLGKAVALGTGFDFARGELIAMMDGDLQDDPQEIPKFVKKILFGYDLVTGWRVKRQDSASKIVTSRMMNFLISFLSGMKLHDFYCGLKCFRKEALGELNLYGGLYRFIPILAYQNGLRITELPVKHHHRKFGKSKYGGFKRFKRALTDMAIILFVIKYRRISPMVFSLWGAILFLLGSIAIIYHYLIVGLMVVGLGALFLSIGFMANLTVKRQIAIERRRKDGE